MRAFDEAILVRMMGITDLHLNAQTGCKAQEGGREIAAMGTADPAHVAVESDLLGQPRPLPGLRQAIFGRFGREGVAHLSLKQDGGAHIDDIEGFDHMVPLAIGIGADSGDIECASICQLLSGAGRSLGSG